MQPPSTSSLPSPSARATSSWILIGIWNSGLRLRKADQAPPELPPLQQEGTMRFVCLSDTHSYHSVHQVPAGDVLIHAGDWTRNGEEEDVESFATWLASLPHKHKIVIAGNHDLPMDEKCFGKHFTHQKLLNELVDAEKKKLPSEAIIDIKWTKKREQELVQEYPARCIAKIKSVCTYLVDESVTIDGVCIHGSPWVAGARNWAFSLLRGSEELAAQWKLIPNDTTVLVTHSPPAGLNLPPCTTPLRESYLPDPGCELLRDRCKSVHPLVHICGHIHEHYGIYMQQDGTAVINAAMVDSKQAIVFDLKRREP